MNRLAISAAGVHVGGGFVLLRALLNAVRSELLDGVFDSRVRDRFPKGLDTNRYEFVAPNLLVRALAARRLSKRIPSDGVLLCFNSLPPPVRTNGKVIVFVHAPHFARLHQGIRYGRKTSLRHRYENIWFSVFEHNADEFWVQTEGMQRALRRRLRRGTSVKVVPFVDDDLFGLDNGSLGRLRGARDANFVEPDSRTRSFFYPADNVGHKNHKRLLSAWQMLQSDGSAPELILTLSEAQVTALLDPGFTPSALNIRCVGPVSREEVLSILKGGAALLFPSLAETFGLPLVEAARLGATIVASERDFVRDVCDPAVTFDPLSSVSIARAVMRSQGIAPQRTPLLSPEEFVSELLR